MWIHDHFSYHYKTEHFTIFSSIYHTAIGGFSLNLLLYWHRRRAGLPSRTHFNNVLHSCPILLSLIVMFCTCVRRCRVLFSRIGLSDADAVFWKLHCRYLFWPILCSYCELIAEVTPWQLLACGRVGLSVGTTVQGGPNHEVTVILDMINETK